MKRTVLLVKDGRVARAVRIDVRDELDLKRRLGRLAPKGHTAVALPDPNAALRRITAAMRRAAAGATRTRAAFERLARTLEALDA